MSDTLTSTPTTTPIPPAAPSQGTGLATAALVVGIAAIPMAVFPVLGILVALTALGLGVGAVVRKVSAPGRLIGGFVTGGVGLVVSVLVTVGLFVALGRAGNPEAAAPNADHVSAAVAAAEEIRPPQIGTQDLNAICSFAGPFATEHPHLQSDGLTLGVVGMTRTERLRTAVNIGKAAEAMSDDWATTPIGATPAVMQDYFTVTQALQSPEFLDTGLIPVTHMNGLDAAYRSLATSCAGR